MDPISQLYDQLTELTIRDLVAAFYSRVRTDDIIGPMYPPEDIAGAQERLTDFLIYRFGGSSRYLETRGHPRLRMRHFPFTIDHAAKERWLELMAAAMASISLPPDCQPTLTAFFRQVADAMQNQGSTSG
jgi:hemoglobin